MPQPQLKVNMTLNPSFNEKDLLCVAVRMLSQPQMAGTSVWNAASSQARWRKRTHTISARMSGNRR